MTKPQLSDIPWLVVVHEVHALFVHPAGPMMDLFVATVNLAKLHSNLSFTIFHNICIHYNIMLEAIRLLEWQAKSP